MRVLVCGSRDFNDWYVMSYHLRSIFKPGDVLIHGMARGADQLSEAVVCAGMKSIGEAIQIERYPADWNKHGKAAGPIRNRQMLKEGKPDLVVAFMAPDSRGTKDMVEAARAAGVETRVIDIGNSTGCEVPKHV